MAHYGGDRMHKQIPPFYTRECKGSESLRERDNLLPGLLTAALRVITAVKVNKKSLLIRVFI